MKNVFQLFFSMKLNTWLAWTDHRLEYQNLLNSPLQNLILDYMVSIKSS